MCHTTEATNHLPRILAIGDIHGCSTALRALTEEIKPGPDDLIIVLGDFIDCGPDSRGVIEQLIALSGRCRPQGSGTILDLGFLIGIDTDCFRGGWLTALDVGTGEVIQADERGELARFWKRPRRIMFVDKGPNED